MSKTSSYLGKDRREPSNNLPNGITEHEVRAIARVVSEESTKALMTSLGIDTSTPAAMIQAQIDLALLRRARKFWERLWIGIRLTIFSGGILFVLGLFWEAIKAKAGFSR